MHRGRWTRIDIVLAIFVASVFSTTCLAAEEASTPENAEHATWELEVQSPFWVFGNHGTLGVRGRTVHIDVSPGDAIDLLTSGNAFAGEGYFELRHDRFFTFADALGGYTEESVSANVPTADFPRLGALDIDARLKLKLVLADFGVGYRLGQWTLPHRRRPLTLGLYAGAHYYWFETRLRASASITARLPGQAAKLHRATDVTDTFEWADPLIGLRWEVPVLDCLSADFRADIGGFDVGSDLSWNVMGGLRYWVPFRPFSLQPTLGAGYRALAFDRPAGSDGELDLQFRGPYLSLGVIF
jgi:hypothetical protein